MRVVDRDLQQVESSAGKVQTAAVAGAALASIFTPSLSAQQGELPPTPPAIVQRVDASKQVIQEQAKPIVVQSLFDVAKSFDPNVHVYYVPDPTGNPAKPFPMGHLDILAKELSGTDHYLVVLQSGKVRGSFGSLATHNYVADLHGKKVSFTGSEAGYYYLRDELARRNGKFQSILDGAGLGLPSGSLFVLGVDDRKWSWYESDLHREIGIKSDDTFKNGGRFSSIAKSDFGSGRFQQGILKTVRAIDSERDASPAYKAAKYKMESAKELLASTQRSFKQYVTLQDSLKLKYPGRGGDLFLPDLRTKVEQAISRAQNVVDGGKSGDVSEQLSESSSGLVAAIKSLSEYDGAPSGFSAARKAIEKLRNDEFGFIVRERIKSAEELIAKAEIDWNHGSSAFSAALTSTESLVAEISGALVDGPKIYKKDMDRLADVEESLRLTEASPQGDQVAEDLAIARDNHARAKEAWVERSPAYPTLLNEAEGLARDLSTKIDGIEAAELAALRNKNILYGLGGLLSLAGLGGLGFRMRRNALLRAKAGARLKQLEEAFAIREEGLGGLEQLQERALMSEGLMVQFAPDSATAKLAAKAREKVTSLQLMQVAAHNEIISQATSLIRAGSLLSSANAERALQIMDGHPVIFTAENRDQLQAALNERHRGVDALLVPLSKLGDFTMSLDEIDERSNTLAASAKKELLKIAESREQVATGTQKLKELAGELSGRLAKLKSESESCQIYPGKFNLGDGAAISAKVSKLVSDLTPRAEADPVGCADEFNDTNTLLTLLGELVSSLESFRGQRLVAIGETKANLANGGVEIDWIDLLINQTSEEYCAILKDLSAQIGAETPVDSAPFAGRIAGVTGSLETQLAQAARKLDIVRGVLKNRDALIGEISGLKREICEASKMDPKGFAWERELNPEETLEKITSFANQILSAISNRELEQAEAAEEGANATLSRGRESVSTARSVFESVVSNMPLAVKAIANIEAQLPAHKEILEGLIAKYEEGALSIGADLGQFEGNDGTVANNIEELTEELAALKKQLSVAEDDFKSGRINGAYGALVKVSESTKFCNFRLSEISYFDQELGKAVVEVEKGRAKVLERIEGLSERVRDFRASAETEAEFLQVKEKASQSLSENKRAKVSPFTQLATLREVNNHLKSIEAEFKADLEEFAAAEDAVAAAGAAMQRLSRIVSKVEGDTLPDGRALDEVREKLPALEASLAKFEGVIRGAKRQNWVDIDASADKLAAKIERLCEGMKEEAQAAESAEKALKSAIKSVGNATKWVGSYGIAISGEPGKEELASARKLFQSGRFAEAETVAKDAASLAKSAVAEVETLVSEEKKKRAKAASARARARKRSEGGGGSSRRARSSSSDSTGWDLPDIPSVIVINSDSGRSNGGSSFPDISLPDISMPSMPDIDFSGAADAVGGAVSSLAEGVADAVGGAVSDW